MTTLGVTYSEMYSDLEGLINVGDDAPSLVSSAYNTSNAIIQDFDLRDTSEDEEYNQFISQSKQALNYQDNKIVDENNFNKKDDYLKAEFEPISSSSLGIEDPIKDVQEVIDHQQQDSQYQEQQKHQEKSRVIEKNKQEIISKGTRQLRNEHKSKEKSKHKSPSIKINIMNEEGKRLFSDYYNGTRLKINSNKYPNYNVESIKDIDIKRDKNQLFVRLITREKEFEDVSKQLTRLILYVDKNDEILGEDRQSLVFRGKKNLSTDEIVWEQEEKYFNQYSSLLEINGMAPEEKTHVSEMKINVHQYEDEDVIKEKVIYSPIYETIHKSVERQIIYLSSRDSSEIKRYNHCAINKAYVRNLHTKEDFALKSNKLNDAEIIKQLPDQSFNIVNIERNGQQILVYCDESQNQSLNRDNRSCSQLNSSSDQLSKEELFNALYRYKQKLPQSSDEDYYSQFEFDNEIIVSKNNIVKNEFSQLSLSYLTRYQQRFIKQINQLRSLLTHNQLDDLQELGKNAQFVLYQALEQMSQNNQQEFQQFLSKSFNQLNLTQENSYLELVNQRQRFSLGFNASPELIADQDVLQLINQSLLGLKNGEESQLKELCAVLSQSYTNILCVLNIHLRDNIDKESLINKSRAVYSVARIYY